MKFTIDSSVFSKHIDRALKFVPTKPLLPILATIKIDAIGNNLRLASFDLSNGIELNSDAEIIEAGSVCVPAQLLSSIVKSLKGQIVFNLDGTTATIADLSGSCEIQCQESDEYPDFANNSDDDNPVRSECEIDAKLFAQAVKICSSSASLDETKSMLQGINFKAANGLLVAAATDGHRLTVLKLAIDPSVSIESCTMPVKPISAIECDEDISLSIGRSICSIGTDDSQLLCRLYGGTYPQYELLMPKSFKQSIELDKSALLDALSLMSSIGAQNNLVKISLESNSMKLASSNEGAKGQRNIDCNFSGDPVEMGLNIKYLTTALKTIPTTNIKISINDPMSPIVINPIDSDLDLICLLMPVRLA
jgi:DNA polymerase-3 subunit beta